MLTAFPGSFEVDDEEACSFRSWLEKSEESSSSRFEFSGPNERGVAEKRRVHDDDGRGTDRTARRLRWTFGANIIVGDGNPKLARPSSKVHHAGGDAFFASWRKSSHVQRETIIRPLSALNPSRSS